MDRRGWLFTGAGLMAVGAGVVGAGAATIGASLVRQALRSVAGADDGPDDLLATPTALSSTSTVIADDGTRLNVVSYGPEDAAGDVIVAIHGWTCNTSYWNPQINRFASQRRVIAYDQRGHGGSELGATRPTIETLGLDLNAVLDAMVPAGRKAVLIGHSMGGMTIMSWAAQYPHKVDERISAVVLASTAADALIANQLLLPVDLPRYSKPFAPTMLRMLISAPLPVPRTAYGPRFTQYLTLGPAARPSHVAFVDEMVMSCPPRVRGLWGAAMTKLDVGAGLAALTVPTTVVVGADDRLTPPSHANRIAEVLRNNGNLADLVVYDGVGHMSTIETAGEFNELLEKVLAG